MNKTALSIGATMAVLAIMIPSMASAFGTAKPQQQMEVRHRTFTDAEVAEMSEVTALIRTSLGEIRLKFFPEDAPNHVRNFIDLAKSGFYDRTVFHRVIPGFMIQGGDPKSKDPRRAAHGTGGPDYLLKAEFNGRPHLRRTLSMARRAHPDSAGSQFFICVAPAPYLDRQYTVFGEVISGMEVVDKIVNLPRDSNNNPLERVEVRVRIIEPRKQKSTAPKKAPPPREQKGAGQDMGNRAIPDETEEPPGKMKTEVEPDKEVENPAGETREQQAGGVSNSL